MQGSFQDSSRLHRSLYGLKYHFQYVWIFPAVKFASYLLNDPLVGVEIEVQLGVVLLDYDPGGLLDCLGAYTAHFRVFFGDGVEKLARRTRRSAGKGRELIIRAKSSLEALHLPFTIHKPSTQHI